MKTRRSAASVGLLLTASVVALTGVLAARARQQPSKTPVPGSPLVTGKFITPVGSQTNVGSYPNNAILSPDGKYVVVTSLGARCRLSVLSVTDGSLVSQADFTGPHPSASGKKESVFYGLAFGPQTPEGVTLYAARGSDDRVAVLTLASDGKLTRTTRELVTPSKRKTSDGSILPLHPAGLALSGNGSVLYAANHSGDPANKMESTLSVVDTASGIVLREIITDGYPLAVVALSKGQFAGRKVYVGSEQRGTVDVVDVEQRQVTRTIPTGSQTTGLLLNRAEDKLFAANGGSDTVSIIDVATEKVTKTILLRPPDARGIPGATPLGMALSPDEATLYVALADMNAVAVVDLKKNTVTGYIPAGWYPTAVVVSPDGNRLFIMNAKGTAVRNPNGAPVPIAGGVQPQYVQNIIEGTVSTVELPGALSDLPKHTAQVLTNNRISPDMLKIAREALKNPGIEHVIYIVKENRTYDQVLGDLPQGNGDPKLVLFGRDVTPNLHALAERFILLDNFYCCAEVSGDGWNWSTQGMITPYNSRNVVYGYTGKVRTYDYEGTNNGVPVDLEDIPDVSKTAGGYIWDNCARNKVSFRNFGFFADDETRPGPEEGPQRLVVVPNKKALVGKTSIDFRQYDTNYADSEAWVKHGLKPAPRQLAEFKGAPARMTVWLREFEGFVKSKNMPRFQMLRLGRDHTAGTAPGQYSPRAMVADNDYAVGQLVEAVSKSPYWKKTAIFVIEDDAQAGYDHVDAHRSIAFVISPFIRKATKDSRFYNTDSMIRTMEVLLNMPPMNGYTAAADPFYIFTAQPENDQPYTAILPAKEIIGDINGARAYRAQDSLALLNPLKEESEPDEQLNDILWHSIKGENVPAPPRVYTLSAGPREEGEDDD